MGSAIAGVALALSMAATGGWFDGRWGHNQASTAHVRTYNPYPVEATPHSDPCQPGGRIVGPGPGLGWGFANGNPDGVGWVDYGDALPLGSDRTPEYFFRRYYSVLPQQMFFPSYYNPYLQRGQRYIPYSGCGGEHPFGGAPQGDSRSPYRPSLEAQRNANQAAGPQAPVLRGVDESRDDRTINRERPIGPESGAIGGDNTEPPIPRVP